MNPDMGAQALAVKVDGQRQGMSRGIIHARCMHAPRRRCGPRGTSGARGTVGVG
jgi:hypothetical protein